MWRVSMWSVSIDGFVKSPELVSLSNLRDKERAQWLSPTFTSL